MQVSEDEPGIDESNWYVSTSPVRDNKFLQHDRLSRGPSDDARWSRAQGEGGAVSGGRRRAVMSTFLSQSSVSWGRRAGHSLADDAAADVEDLLEALPPPALLGCVALWMLAILLVGISSCRKLLAQWPLPYFHHPF